MKLENSLRVFSYIRSEDISARLTAANDLDGVSVEEFDGTTRVAIPKAVLARCDVEQVSDFVSKLIGGDEAPSNQLVLQQNSDTQEISITLIDLEVQPPRVMPSEMVSVREAVAEFLGSQD